MSDAWERNEDRWWYDRGYALGAVETKRDAAVPRLIGAWTLLGAVMWDPLVAGTFLGMYSAFTLLNWRDRRDKATERRERYDPGPAYEGMERDEDAPELSEFGDNGGGDA